jgi:hypothetical protein
MKKDKVKIQIHIKRLPHRNDAMFYYGKHIATITKGNRKLFVESSGEMEAYFSKRGVCYKNEMLAKELLSRKTTDNRLVILWENDLIMMNNWFRIYDEVNPNDEKIAGTYDGAMELAVKRINEA